MTIAFAGYPVPQSRRTSSRPPKTNTGIITRERMRKSHNLLGSDWNLEASLEFFFFLTVIKQDFQGTSFFFHADQNIRSLPHRNILTNIALECNGPALRFVDTYKMLPVDRHRVPLGSLLKVL